MTKSKKKTWDQLDHETRLERITTLWNDGKSDKEIAEELSATKGQVVGYRHTHLPNVTAATRGMRQSVPSPMPRPKAASIPHKAAKAEQPEPMPPAPSPEVRSSPPKESRMSSRSSRLIAEPAGEPSPGFAGKMTSDWTKQCGHIEDGRQCGFHFTVRRGEEKRCNVHADEIR